MLLTESKPASRPTAEELRKAGDRGLAQNYLDATKGANLSIGVSRKWNDEDVRRAYIAGRREEREDPR